MAGRAPFLPEKVARYIREHSVREPAVLRELREATKAVPCPACRSAPTKASSCSSWCRPSVRAAAWRSAPTLATARLPSRSRCRRTAASFAATSARSGPPSASRSGRRPASRQKIDLRIGPALETLKGLKGPFDFVFIDADKPNYLKYYEGCLPLLRKNGIIAIDNTLWSGAVADPGQKDADTVALRQFNDALHGDQRVALSMLPLGDGVTLALKV